MTTEKQKEANIEKNFYRALHQLKELQKARKKTCSILQQMSSFDKNEFEVILKKIWIHMLFF